MEIMDVFKRKRFWDIAGISAIILSLSFNAGSILGALSTKQAPSKYESNSVRQGRLKSINSYAAAVEKNPFGIKGARFYVIEKKSGETAGGDPKGLLLRGVITLHPGYAFIENKDNSQKLFKLGDDVFGLGTLKLVQKDKVGILSGGKTFDLILMGSEKFESQKPGLFFPAADAKKQTGVKEKSFQKEEIKRFLDNPKEILTDARLLPNLKDGKQEGFMVREVKPGGFYDNIGLANGDIILRANGIDLTSPSDGVKIFSMIKELDRVELDILRNGLRTTHVYHIN